MKLNKKYKYNVESGILIDSDKQSKTSLRIKNYKKKLALVMDKSKSELVDYILPFTALKHTIRVGSELYEINFRTNKSNEIFIHFDILDRTKYTFASLTTNIKESLLGISIFDSDK